MASYGRNFEFRIPPRPSARGGRFISPATLLTGSGAGGGSGTGGSPTGAVGLLPIGAPVIADLTAGVDAQGAQYVKLATSGAQWAAAPGAGLLCYEYGPAAFALTDPYMTTYSDLGIVPLNTYCIVIAGDLSTKILLRNTSTFSFLGQRSYTGRTMIAGMGATPTVTVGQYLFPYSGDDVDGYWEATSSATGAWAEVTRVDTTRAEVEARLLF
jgi:hypothetical protein